MKLVWLIALVIASAGAGCASGGGGSSGGGGGCCLVPSCSVPLNFNLCGSSTPPASAPPPASTTTTPKAEAPARASDEALRRRAAFELDCDAAKMEIVVLDATTRGVRGCERRATYVERCAANKCEWEPVATPPPPAAGR